MQTSTVESQIGTNQVAPKGKSFGQKTVKQAIQLISCHCSKCGVGEVKLWRKSDLVLCARCLSIHLNIDIVDIGLVSDDIIKDFSGFIPAIPTKRMDAFWDVYSLPPDRKRFWKKLKFLPPLN